jgi:hypothetical protein
MSISRNATIPMPDAWEHPFTVLKKGLTTHAALIESAFEIVLAAALITPTAVEGYRLVELAHFCQQIYPEEFFSQISPVLFNL